jgi:hypothetical protein
MSWNIQKPGDFINGPLTVVGATTISGDLTAARWLITGGSLPGVGNANPFAYRIGGGGLGIGAATETGTTAPIVFYCGAGGVEQYRIAPLGVNTWSDGAGGTRMTLNSTGLAVGTTTQYARLTLVATGSTSNANVQNSGLSSVSGSLSCYIGHDSTANRPFLQSSTGNAGTTFDLLMQPYGGNLLLGITTPVANGGVLQLKSGITFPATQVASSDANTLDDYEEGTWTGVFTFSGTPQTSSNSFTGRYTKVGRIVSVQSYLLIGASGFVKGPAAGGLQITGLPFAASVLGTAYQDLAASIADINSGSLCFLTIAAGGSVLSFESVGVVGSVVQRNSAAITQNNFASTNAGFISLSLNFTYTV